MKKKYELDEKDTVLRLRLPSSMKNDLQALAEQKGLNLSQFLRNYIESVLNTEDNQDLPPRRMTPPPFKADMEANISIRCHQKLKNDFNDYCMESSRNGSELLRKFIRDTIDVFYKEYYTSYRPIRVYIDYLIMFLQATEWNNHQRHLTSLKLYKDIDIPEDTPSIERVGGHVYRVNDIQNRCFYLLEFEQRIFFEPLS